MSNTKLQFLITSLALGLLVSCASDPTTQSRITEQPAASEYRHITGSHIKREVPVDARYLNSTHRVRIIGEAEMRETGSTNIAKILDRSGVFFY